ncbi:MAG: hypothetical protein HY791_00915 [Deltaproteobacteria bacterium]|nr:hypothetical protein [Deltaproteobacteria bacterium]
MASEGTGRRLSPKELYRRAFLNQYNLIFLGGSGLWSMTTQSWIPLLVGVGAEILWMVLGADTDKFHGWAHRQATAEAAASSKAALDEAVEKLQGKTKDRFRALRAEAEEIEKLVREGSSTNASVAGDQAGKLDQLLRTFVRLAETRARLSAFLDQTSEKELLKEIERDTQRLEAAEETALRTSLERSLDLANKRLAQFRSLRSSHEAIDIQLANIEKSVRYLKSCILTPGTDDFSQELDDLIEGAHAAELAQAETNEMLNDLRRVRAASAERSSVSR